MNASGSYIPIRAAEAETEVKKSRFIALLYPAKDRSEAMTRLDQVRQAYPDARHHCWAYILGNPQRGGLAAQSDDGEPSGTAGKPILNVMQHKQLRDAMLIVVRYFGGTKLGAGGLVRAYGAATQAVIDQADLAPYQTMKHVEAVFDFKFESQVRRWADELSIEITGTSYSDTVRYHMSFPEQVESTLKEKLSTVGHIQSIDDD